MEERNVTIGKFLATLYLSGRGMNLTFDRLMNDPMSLANYTPITQRSNLISYPISNGMPAEVI